MPAANQPDLSRPRRLFVRACLVVVSCFAMLAACNSSCEGPIADNVDATLRITLAGTGTGRVITSASIPEYNGSFGGLDCGLGGTRCSFTGDLDADGATTITFIATDGAGSTLTGWTNDCTVEDGNPARATLFMDQETDFECVATFDLTVTAACNNPFVIQDPFTSDAGWTTSVIVGSGAPTQTVAYQANGGNPGGYRYMQHIFPAAGSITVYHDYGTTTYDPGTQGAIDHLNYYEDEIEMNPPFAGAAVGAGFTLRQGAGRYNAILRPPTGAFTNTTWQTTSLLDLTAASFSAGLNLATGGPITFGYFRNNSNDAGTLTVTHGIDNWKVEICR